MSLLSRYKSLALPPLMATLLAFGACSAGQPPAPPLPDRAPAPVFTAADAGFAQKLNDMNIRQITLARLAQTHAARSDIATQAATIVKDLTGNQARLAALMTAHAITLPTEPSSADRKTIDRMRKLHGPAFDRGYMRVLSRDRAGMTPVIQDALARSRNPDLTKLAIDTKTMLAAYQAQL
ncbi:DUF4142 domain-containing protein [Gluconacetobacter sacchari]|uniref:DUF4142 domain-containing protein n=2 Tax=Gluconacetobacter sacchari TaxID=92759 RepID=A0A7W4IBN0_9PROT|nr:DUF4142 domain-containing protein [Gluconacetobacter sacchari]MBB2159875.1 DUF4142 domain-containing protein [Gluconacetobacter sacchari]GBQ26900.1 hypothetical protein AA12717_2497 [Gluconacetobacter sacchari DSM 12717]